MLKAYLTSKKFLPCAFCGLGCVLRTQLCNTNLVNPDVFKTTVVALTILDVGALITIVRIDC